MSVGSFAALLACALWGQCHLVMVGQTSTSAPDLWSGPGKLSSLKEPGVGARRRSGDLPHDLYLDLEAGGTAPKNSPDDRSSGADPRPPVARPVMNPIQPASRADEESFQWWPATWQAANFTAVMHAKRLLTEPGTRDALRGPFWKDYLHSVTALRGWDDADGFYTSYAGHPMEGSVFAFIQKQNDPRYRGLRFNEGRSYWISQLRAMAFAAIWSTQWTLGLASEASIGNAPLYNSPGFVDLVGTPTFGVGWSIGEDFIDRYLIERLEERTANRALLMLVRGFGNPTRSFANLMGGRIPWQRETRPGLFKANFVTRSENVRSRKEYGARDSLVYASSDRSPLLAAPASVYPKAAPIELEATAHYETFLGGGSCIGGGGSGAFRFSPSWQFVAEISGCLIIEMPDNESGDSLLYLAGMRWTPRATRSVSPYLQFMAGGRKVTHEVIYPKLRAALQNAWDGGQLPHYPKRSESSIEDTANGFALLAGGGLDINVHPALTLRVAKLEYTRSFLPSVDRIDAERGVRFTSGLVLRIGTW